MPNSRSKNVEELLGIFAALADVDVVVVVEAFAGSGLVCSPKTRRRLSAVPSGVHVRSVMVGLVVGCVRALTSVGFTTCFLVIW